MGPLLKFNQQPNYSSTEIEVFDNNHLISEPISIRFGWELPLYSGSTTNEVIPVVIKDRSLLPNDIDTEHEAEDKFVAFE